jgi:hypothetical protein
MFTQQAHASFKHSNPFFGIQDAMDDDRSIKDSIFAGEVQRRPLALARLQSLNACACRRRAGLRVAHVLMVV